MIIILAWYIFYIIIFSIALLIRIIILQNVYNMFVYVYFTLIKIYDYICREKRNNNNTNIIEEYIIDI